METRRLTKGPGAKEKKRLDEVRVTEKKSPGHVGVG